MSEKMVDVQCKGRGREARPVFDQPINVSVRLSQCGDIISVNPQHCPFNTGGHGQRCKASHPDQDKVGIGIGCPYSFDYPYACGRPDWTMPSELKDVIAEMSSE